MTSDTTSNLPAVRQQVALGAPQGDFDAAYRLAKNLALSNIIPDALRGKPADVLVIVLYGQELGLAPMQAMQVIDVVKGRPTLRAHLWVALARKAGHRVSVTEETDTSCTVRVVRCDDPTPQTVTYTLDTAKTAGLLLSNDNYRKNPADMLYARAASKCIRRACPEVALGFGDEYELAAASEPDRPSLAQVAAEREDAPFDIVAGSTHGRLNAARPEPATVDDTADAETVADAVAEIERAHVTPAQDEPDEDTMRAFAMKTDAS